MTDLYKKLEEAFGQNVQFEHVKAPAELDFSVVNINGSWIKR